MLVFHWIHHYLLKGQEGHESAKATNSHPSRGGMRLKTGFLIKNALCLYLELCFLLQREAYFQKNHEKMLPESENWSQDYVRYMKIPPAWGRIHEDGVKIMSDLSVKSLKEATCSNNTRKCDVLRGSAWEAWRG